MDKILYPDHLADTDGIKTFIKVLSETSKKYGEEITVYTEQGSFHGEIERVTKELLFLKSFTEKTVLKDDEQVGIWNISAIELDEIVGVQMQATGPDGYQ